PAGRRRPSPGAGPGGTLGAPGRCRLGGVRQDAALGADEDRPADPGRPRGPRRGRCRPDDRPRPDAGLRRNRCPARGPRLAPGPGRHAAGPALPRPGIGAGRPRVAATGVARPAAVPRPAPRAAPRRRAGARPGGEGRRSLRPRRPTRRRLDAHLVGLTASRSAATTRPPSPRPLTAATTSGATRYRGRSSVGGSPAAGALRRPVAAPEPLSN